MRRSSRLERAEKLVEAENRLATGQTLRQVAADLGSARSTVQDGRRAKKTQTAALPAALTACVATPEGVGGLHRRVRAAHVAITLRGGAGVRMVCEFLELSGLSAVVGASYGSPQALNAAVETALVALAKAQRTELAEGMAPRQITVCEDETFPPETCWVSLEPVSGFILLEQYAEHRSAATWTEALRAALEGLKVEVIQGTGDQAKALRRPIEQDYQAHQSPDLFHGRHEGAKATSLHLARPVKPAEAQAAAAEAQWNTERAAAQAYQDQRPHPPGRPPAFGQRVQTALTEWAAAQAEHEQAPVRQVEARAMIRELGELYHPYDLQQGQVQSVECVAARFEAVWTRLKRLAEAADLPTRARERLAKAQRLTTQLLATLTFFFATLHSTIETLNLPPAIEQAVIVPLIPTLYLARVAERRTDADSRPRLRTLSAHLLEPLRRPDHPLQRLAPEERPCIEQVAQDCADRFQRSRSAVEGRDGPLALYHHGRHRLSRRKLASLTAVHTYYVRRPDGTTAAERFFGRAHASLFEQLTEHVPLPPPPRRRRPSPPRRLYLMSVAA
jgi:Family of unknown function (DUF6399)